MDEPPHPMNFPPLRMRVTALAGGLTLAALVMHAEDGAPTSAGLPAFPGAEGFGAYATGGRTGTVYHVTNLNDAGPGSFRDAVSEPNRIVVFDVGGLIRVKSNVSLSSNLTVAGQTAPGEGIGLYGEGVSLSKEGNTIIRYLRFRQGIGGDRGKKALSMGDTSHDNIVDHCTIMWGRWDNLGITTGANNVTVQNCLVAEGIDPQQFGSLTDTATNITMSHNLWMNNNSRNPKLKATAQYINNVVYNWGETGFCGGHSGAVHTQDLINNYFIKGPESKNDHFVGQCTDTDHVFQEGNLADLDCDGKLSGRPVEEKDFPDGKPYPGPTFMKKASMSPAFPVTVDSAADAYAKVVAGAGCSLQRDEVDLRLISELTSLGKKGKLLLTVKDSGGKVTHTGSEADVGGQGPIAGGTAPVDTDKDGIPDVWEKAHGLNPNDPSDAMKLAPSGYTNLEVYVNSLAAPAKATIAVAGGAASATAAKK